MEPNDRELIETPVSSEELYNGRVVHLFRDTVRLPNGKTATREVVRHPGAVAIVPITEQGDVILVRQYRYPFAQIILEIPAGKLDPGESPEACARRELQEETGAQAAELIPIGVYYPSVAILDEKIHLFIARGLTAHEAKLDEDEFLHVTKRPLQQLVDEVLRGEIPDGKTQTAILKTYYLLSNGVIPDKQPE